jgi:adsorption protein B
MFHFSMLLTAWMPGWLEPIDRAMLRMLAPLAVAILISGLDDMLIDVAWAAAWIRRKLLPQAPLFPPGARQLDSAPQHRIAILVPLWQEDRVIARMLEHNIAAIRYSDYHIFAGAYPNDQATQAAIRSAAGRFSNVHLALCPHDGPTSKADCLNWIYQHVCLHEEETGEQFEVLVTHDAEDLIHPDELRWINFYSTRYDFIQTPVLALPTPLWALTHGIYCDEFAEYHMRDMPVRPMLGGFLPSAGVGTGYRREALQKLAESSSNRVFEPEALTEDYENGLKLFRLGCSQAFVPVVRGEREGRKESENRAETNGRTEANNCGEKSDGGGPDIASRETHDFVSPRSHDFVVTREFFPKDWSSALKQRTRWVMGIALQGWQRYGWAGRPGEVYWLWRDRKGLVANPLSLASNVMFVYGAATGMWMRATPIAAHIAILTLGLQTLRLAVRMACSARVYGVVFALGVPVRAVYANLLNSAATFQAVVRYSYARARGRPLKWVKTEHAYPSRAALLEHKRRLGEILVGSGYLTAAALKSALAGKPAGVRLGEYLIGIGRLDEGSLYEALALQQGLPVSDVDAGQIQRDVARALPERVIREWRVLPFRVEDGALYVAGPDAPPAGMNEALRPYTTLEVRFHLVTPTKFAELTKALV